MNQMSTPKIDSLVNDAFCDLDSIRKIKPVIHNVTNWVVMQTTANLLLAVGASPIMAHAKEELADIVSIAHALVINIGTLDAAWIEAIKCAQQAALSRHIPVIFDPVGAGASSYRTETAKEILNRGVQVLRGNASEVMALVSCDIKTKGVDSKHRSNEAVTAAKMLCEKYKITVVISGETDMICDPEHELFVPYGTPLFTRVTGMGCSATALIGAFSAINKNYFLAASHAMMLFSLAGELAAANSQGPASFYNTLTDTLFSLQKEDLTMLNLEGRKA